MLIDELKKFKLINKIEYDNYLKSIWETKNFTLL